MANRIEQEIVVKVIGGKDVAALEKQIKALEKEKAKLTVDADTDEARSALEDVEKQLAELKSEKAELEVTAQVNQALDALDEVATESKKAEAAANALADALGPELAAGADLDRVVAGFRDMGLSLDTVTAHADKLGAKLKEVAKTDPGGNIDNAFRRAKGSVDELGKSASSSKSAMANMVGNTAQDVGALGGVAGSTGVAIGQMAEYMADAAFEGESLTVVMRNFAKVALPILAIGAAVATFQGVLSSLKKDEEEATKTTEELGAAFKDTGDWVTAAGKVLRDHADDLEHYTNRITSFGEAIDTTIIGKGLSKLPVIGENFKQATTDVVAGLESVGLTLDDVAESTEGNVIFNRELEQTLLDGLNAGKLTEQQYKDITDAIHAYQIEVKAAKEETAKLQLTGRTFGQLIEAITLGTAPLEHFTDIWDRLFAAIQAGDEAGGAAIANTLANLLHIADPAQVVALAMAELKRRSDELGDSQEENRKKAEEWAKAQQKAADDAADALGDAKMAIDDMASSFEVMARNSDALEAAFDLGNAPLDALEAVTDINDAIRDLHQFIKEEGTPFGKDGLLDPTDVDAGPFLDKIRSLRVPIQQAITDAFATGGPPAARATADAYVEQIVASMHGRLTAAQVQDLLGLTDLEATLKIAVDQSSLAAAQQMLEILTGLQGETPWTATVQLALAAGEISPDAARVLIAKRLEDLGVPVPAVLEEPTEGSKTASVAAAQRWMAEPGHEVDMHAQVNDPELQSLIDARNAGQDDADNMPIVFPSTVAQPDIPWWVPHDAGGTVGPAGGIAGERGTEILDDRYLTAGPTYVPPGTKVTSRRRTAVILRRHGARGLRQYDAGGMVPAGNVTVNFNGVGAIGNRYDLMRTVHRANLDKIRLQGTRG